MNYEIWKLPAAERMENGEPGGGVVLCSPHMLASGSSLVSSVTSLIINWEI